MTTVGHTEERVTRLGLRYAATAHALAVACFGLVGVVAVPPEDRPELLAVVAIAIAWTAGYSGRLDRRGSSYQLVTADVIVVSAVCFLARSGDRIDVPATQSAWALALGSFVAVTYQWHTSIAGGLVAALVIDAALLAGTVAAVGGSWHEEIPSLLWILTEAALSRAVWILVRRAARAADRVAADAHRARRRTELAAARREDERRSAGLLHDTAATTLMMVGTGQVRRTDRWLAGQARRDLGALAQLPAAAGRSDVVALLREVVDGTPVAVRFSARDPRMPLPPDVAEAISGGVREALTNVLRHAGVRAASVTVTPVGAGVVVEVSDQGRGFDPAVVAPTRRGLSEAVHDRMREVGGEATITSRAGAGTTIRLEWAGG